MRTLSLKPFAVFGAAALLTLAASMAFATTPARAAGLTSAQINAIISLLSTFGADQATINNVSAALHGQATGSISASSNDNFCHAFTVDLKFGDSATDHDNQSNLGFLQRALRNEGFVIDDSDNSHGSMTAWQNFGNSTLAAVKQFQAKYGIPATGYVGPLTRAKLNQLYGCGGSASANSTQFSATIDQSSLTTGSNTPTITGSTTAGPATFVVSIKNTNGTTVYQSVPPINNGQWSIAVSPALAADTYQVIVSGGGAGNVLTTGTLTVTAQ